MRSLLRLLCALLLAFSTARAVPVDTVNFFETTYLNDAGIGLPTGIAWAPDGSGRLFVIRKAGEVRIVQHNPATNTGTLVATPFATISPVFTNSECGLIGLCFDPDFINNGHVYFFVTVSASEQQIIRYTDSASIGMNKTVIVPGLPTLGQNHDGGGVGIGPDGRLYWSIGDNGNNTGVDANLTSLAAKVGRANRFTGAALNDNPFFDGAGANADHIWARGFRNPFTLTFQPGTGKLWVNVVGSSASGGTQPLSGFGYEQVFIVGRGDHVGWNDYENNQPAGFLAPVIAYRTNAATTMNLAAVGAARAGGGVTFTTTAFHPFRQGARVTIAAVANASFNGTFFVANRVSDTEFTVAQAGPDAISGGGTATTLNVGGSITGGCFYDSTAFPAAYRGNFFTGDVNTGNMVRATLDANDVPTSVDLFVTGSSTQVDVATGPDGALYYANHSNQRIRRLATTSTAQNVIVHPTAFDVSEGGSSMVTVRLARAPAANVTVSVAATGGDADLTVAAGASLTFTPANWNQFQTATIAAAEDADRFNDSATFQVSAVGIATHNVAVNGIDNDEPQLVLSRNNVAFTETGTGSFTVALASAPAADVTVAVARSGGDADITVSAGASLTFTTANFATPQTVTLAAANDPDSIPDTATISVTLAGDPVRTVNVAVADNDNAAPIFTSTPILAATVNAPYRYDADATGNPPPSFSFVGTPPVGMTINNSTGVINWTPASTGTFAVSIRASNGVGAAPTQSFDIVVSADTAPTATITQPLAGAVVSGANAEFFGDGVDDVGTVKAEFFVDGVLRSTDINSDGHYHYGGSHALFDTTLFTNGTHTLRLRVTDTIEQTGEQQVQVTIGNGAAAWRAEKFTAAELADPLISGDLADPDRDGLVNIFEYSADTAPKSPNLSRLPQLRVVNVGGADYLALEFVQVKWATDLVYRVEADDDLIDPWMQIDPADPLFRVSALDNTPAFGLITVIVRDTVPLSSGPRYLRLRVTR